jgi:hypothetical protein
MAGVEKRCQKRREWGPYSSLSNSNLVCQKNTSFEILRKSGSDADEWWENFLLPEEAYIFIHASKTSSKTTT